MATNVDLLCSYWTLAGGGAEPHTDHEYCPWDFKDRVEAAARAGFRGMGIWHADLEHTLKKRSLKEMRTDPRRQRHQAHRARISRRLVPRRRREESLRYPAQETSRSIAEVLRAHHIKVGHFVKTQATMPKMIESFAALCADGANHGALIGFEMMPFCDIDSVEKAMQLVGRRRREKRRHLPRPLAPREAENPVPEDRKHPAESHHVH